MPKYSSLALAVCACYENVDEKTLNKAATCPIKKPLTTSPVFRGNIETGLE